MNTVLTENVIRSERTVNKTGLWIPTLLNLEGQPTWNRSIDFYYIQGDTKKREILKNPKKIEEIQKKKLLTEIEPLQLAF